MSFENPYFQFPLCLLAYESDIPTRLHAIVDFCVLRTGQRMGAELGSDEVQTIADEFPEDYLPQGSDLRLQEHQLIVAAMGRLKIQNGAICHMIKSSQKAEAVVAGWNHAFGPQPVVRIKADYLWEVLNGGGLSYREFSGLCAIYSCIGAKTTPVRITRDTIAIRMLGYKSNACFHHDYERRGDRQKVLSPRQINYLVDKLHERQFFARARANERQTYYSHRLSQQQLENQLVESKTYSVDFHTRRQQRQAEIMAKIKAAKSIKANTAIKVDNNNGGMAKNAR